MTSLQFDILEAEYKKNPEIGRVKLMNRTGIPERAVREFILVKKQTAPKEDVKSCDEVLKQFTPLEISIIKCGLQVPQIEPQEIEWSGTSFKFAHITDTHMGHKLSKLEWWLRAVDLIEKERCQFVCHTGDVTEGMNKRIPGHVYELEAIGSTAQIDLSIQRLEMLSCPVYAINGNHDLWGYSNIGFDPCATLASRLERFNYMGMHEADLKIGNVTIKMWHGEDGSSYATSYRTQKFVEQLSGGEKPHILLSGHDHKEIAYTCRNVKVFGGGTMCGQTKWMRNKKLAAHVGFRIIEVWTNETGIERIREEWIPFFV
jgi:predicted phosphodiesterase